MKFLRELQRYS